ncbi:DUF2334 domain-containing protein [Massilia sp. KIM]|uniref:DUF2334 domain-containing protein n=1 Tax=Massilia sp. KIM TaxID=1955422 RepID=UPI00098FC909|nr:polysaccharide deacetylase family protein [Massilia sp. KIM]OON63669.1 DUF2334 domain-containing protein [Massilia sp. KIM]
MSPTEPALCVSIHDVAPATWDECARLAAAIREVADIPLTWLVVPDYHRSTHRAGAPEAMEEGLDAALARGDELALHGYTHLDTGPPARGWRERILRSAYTREGEFAALQEAEAARRIDLGLDWFAARGWHTSGFVAPAWLLGEGGWRALRRFDFAYTTTFTRFHALREGEPLASLFSPSLVYAARNRSGRLCSPLFAETTAAMLARAPLVRLSLHPPDLGHPRLLRDAQRKVEQLLARRSAMTKAAFAALLTSRVPSSPLPASTAIPSPHGRATHPRDAAAPRAC